MIVKKYIENYLSKQEEIKIFLENFNENSEITNAVMAFGKISKPIDQIIEFIFSYYELKPISKSFLEKLIEKILFSIPKFVSQERIDSRLKNLLNNDWTSVFESNNEPILRTIGIRENYYICFDKKNIIFKPSDRGVTPEISLEIQCIYANTCQRCGIHQDSNIHHLYQSDIKFHIGHLFPFSIDRTTIEYSCNNFILLCSQCNIGESNIVLSVEEQFISLQEVIKNLDVLDYDIFVSELQNFNSDISNIKHPKTNSKILERDSSFCYSCTSIVENGNNHKRKDSESCDVNLFPFLINNNNNKNIDNYITLCQKCRSTLLDANLEQRKYDITTKKIYKNYIKKLKTIEKNIKIREELFFSK